MANEIGGISVKLSADVDATGTVKGMAQIEAASDKIQKEFQIFILINLHIILDIKMTR